MKPFLDTASAADCCHPAPGRAPAAARRLGGLAVLLVGIGLAACSTPPQVRFHSLLGSDAPFAAALPPAAAAGTIRLAIAPVGVPAAVDRPQWLVRRADDSLQMLEQDRWAGPLAAEFRAALRARLATRWAVSDGSLPSASTASDGPSWRLVLEILRLDARPATDALIDARWSLLSPQQGGAAIVCSLRIVEPVRGDGTLPIADAYRRAVARLADQIGAGLRAVQSDAQGGCAEALKS